jgi:phosphopantothenoylcysteine decarboxylase/phosphopantothenate--cysteine ligase
MDNNAAKPTILITAGPTREAIDPVRYITNHSSGKMGYAIAVAFLEQGCKVVLVSGPVNLIMTHKDLITIPVGSADEMYRECRAWFKEADIAVFAAAVADYKPAEIFTYKMKKADDEFNLKMVKNVDIAYEFGKLKRDDQVAAGFALETNNEEQNALKKLVKKNLDFVVLNSTQDDGATFGFDTNKITIINRDLTVHNFPLKTKSEAGRDIANAALSCFAG